jgi:hypothetical protein
MFRPPWWSSSGLGTRYNRRRLLPVRSHYGIASCGTIVNTTWLVSEYKIKTLLICKIQRRTVRLKTTTIAYRSNRTTSIAEVPNNLYITWKHHQPETSRTDIATGIFTPDNLKTWKTSIIWRYHWTDTRNTTAGTHAPGESPYLFTQILLSGVTIN